MRNMTTVLAVLILSADPVFAEPIPWNYSVRFRAADGAQNILLGIETYYEFNPETGIEKATPYFVVLQTGEGYTRINYNTEPGITELFSFSSGDWRLFETLPENTAEGRFQLDYSFGNSKQAMGTVFGNIAASGIFTSGTGNFGISLPSEKQTLEVGGNKAKLQFGTRESESASWITMTVTPEAPMAETPEPATLGLAGLGIAGVLGFRLRGRITGA